MHPILIYTGFVTVSIIPDKVLPGIQKSAMFMHPSPRASPTLTIVAGERRARFGCLVWDPRLTSASQRRHCDAISTARSRPALHGRKPSAPLRSEPQEPQEPLAATAVGQRSPCAWPPQLDHAAPHRPRRATRSALTAPILTRRAVWRPWWRHGATARRGSAAREVLTGR